MNTTRRVRKPNDEGNKTAWPSLFVYAAITAAVLFGLFSLADGIEEPSATMAPDLRVLR